MACLFLSAVPSVRGCRCRRLPLCQGSAGVCCCPLLPHAHSMLRAERLGMLAHANIGRRQRCTAFAGLFLLPSSCCFVDCADRLSCCGFVWHLALQKLGILLDCLPVCCVRKCCTRLSLGLCAAGAVRCRSVERCSTRPELRGASCVALLPQHTCAAAPATIALHNPILAACLVVPPSVSSTHARRCTL